MIHSICFHNKLLSLLTLLVRGKRQVLQDVAPVHGLVGLPAQPGVRLPHPQQCVVVVLVVVGLTAQLEAVGRRQLGAVLNPVELAPGQGGGVQAVGVLEAHQRDRGAVEVLVRGEL